jgi:dihydroorotase
MPNTTPSCDSESVVNFIKEKAKKSGYAKVFPIGTLTKNREGKELSEMAELKRSGCVAVSEDGDSVEDNFIMRQACDYAKTFELTVFVHCEDKKLSENGVMNEGFMSTKLGLKGIPNKSESIVIQRDIEIAELTDVKMHICHLSTREGVELIKNAKKRGLQISAEVTPHHLSLTDEACAQYDTNTKMNPPLRTKEDIKALKKALKEGIIDIIATDHAPHLESEKDVEFDNAPFGIIGLETAFCVCKKELVDTEDITMQELIEKLTVNPAAIIGIDPPALTEGSSADITIIDPEKTWFMKKKILFQKVKTLRL